MTWNVSPSGDELSFLMEAGIIYRDSKKMKEAREVFAGVSSLAPKSEVPKVFMGTVSFAEGDFEGALSHYRQAIEMNPKSAFAYVHMGEADLFRMQKESARTHLEKAIELDPRGDYGKAARSLMRLTDMIQFK